MVKEASQKFKTAPTDQTKAQGISIIPGVTDEMLDEITKNPDKAIIGDKVVSDKVRKLELDQNRAVQEKRESRLHSKTDQMQEALRYATGKNSNPDAVQFAADTLASELLSIPGVDKQLVSDLKEIAIRDGDVTRLLNFKIADGKGRLSSLGNMIGQYASNMSDYGSKGLSGTGSFLSTLVNTGDFTQASRNYDRATALDPDTLRRLQEQYGKASTGVIGLDSKDAMEAYLNPNSDVLANRGELAENITTGVLTSAVPVIGGARLGYTAYQVGSKALPSKTALDRLDRAALQVRRLKRAQEYEEKNKGRLPPPTTSPTLLEAPLAP